MTAVEAPSIRCPLLNQRLASHGFPILSDPIFDGTFGPPASSPVKIDEDDDDKDDWIVFFCNAENTTLPFFFLILQSSLHLKIL